MFVFLFFQSGAKNNSTLGPLRFYEPRPPRAYLPIIKQLNKNTARNSHTITDSAKGALHDLFPAPLITKDNSLGL